MKTNLILALGIVAAILSPVSALADHRPAGAVYTITNSPAGNAVQIYDRFEDGRLQIGAAVPTGGLGTGGGLGSQGALSLGKWGRLLLAVNAGSNSVSTFRVTDHGLNLIDIANSGGTKPISVTQHDDLVYVLNGGTNLIAPNIQGFRRGSRGQLVAIANSSWSLSAANAGPAEVAFSPDGRTLVVTEKGTNKVDTFRLDNRGRPVSASYQASNGMTPFGFAFDPSGRLFVSEAAGGAADASSLSSYRLDRNSELDSLTVSAPTTETAACWAAVSDDGRFAYTANAGSGTISGFRIDRTGHLNLLDVDGVTASTGAGSHPVDMVFAGNGKYFYVLANGAPTVNAFKVANDGHLQSIGALPAMASFNGLVAR